MLKVNYLDFNGPRNEDTDTAATHVKLAGFKCLHIDYRNFRTTMTRTIDTRPCDELRASDADWGERDDGSGRRRGGMPISIRLALDPSLVPEGDR